MSRFKLHKPALRKALYTLAVIAAALLSTAAAANAARGSESSGMQVPKKTYSKLSVGDLRDTVNVKFAEGTDVRLRGGHLVSLSAGRIPALEDTLARFPGVAISRVFHSSSEEQLAASQQEGHARSGRDQADLNLYFQIQVEPGTDTVALLDALNALDIVEVAAAAPRPGPPPATPSFVSRQGYRNPASSGGIDASFAETLMGGRGSHVRVVDIEDGWNRAHEDLAEPLTSAISNGLPCNPEGSGATNHGTAVLGIITGNRNPFGVTGLATDASIRTVNASSLRGFPLSCRLSIANSINVAANNTSPGDVILIELQVPGPNRTSSSTGHFGMVPVEWEQSGAVRAAIRNATDRGRIVIEPAGNGGENLDSSAYDDAAGRNWFATDSGAIMVGAGNAPDCTSSVARSRVVASSWASNYGSRLNVQGWGNCIATTGTSGTADLQGGSNSNLWYTSQFGGTSGASAIVASSAAVVSSIVEARGCRFQSPAFVRGLLASTGQLQAVDSRHSTDFGVTYASDNIGPLPNLRATFNRMLPSLSSVTLCAGPQPILQL